MSDEWGPWIDHDGACDPIPDGVTFMAAYEGAGLRMPDIFCDAWPGFFWQWQTVRTGWFRSERRRICNDPAYAPVIRYRFRRPRSLAVFDAALAGRRADAPEGPIRQPKVRA